MSLSCRSARRHMAGPVYDKSLKLQGLVSSYTYLVPWGRSTLK